MDSSKILLLVVSLSTLLLSSNAVPSTRLFDTLSLSAAPDAAPMDAKGFLDSLFSAAKEPGFVTELLDLCRDTENSTLCVESISPFIQGALDPIKALETEIGATLNKTENTIHLIVGLLGKYKSKSIDDALNICKEEYEDIIDTVKETLDLLSKNDVSGAWIKFGAVISSQATCEDTFKETPELKMPFSDESNAIFQLGGNCLGILQRLNGEKPRD